MKHQQHGPTALHILHDILQGRSSTSQLTAAYGISVFSLKRHLCELRHLGVELSRYSAGGQQVWSCRNKDLVQSSALYIMWLRRAEAQQGQAVRAA